MSSGLGISRRKNLWFGTLERSGWFNTPASGADVSPQGWSDNGTLVNGGGYAFTSWGSHRQYIFEWSGASSRKTAQLMHSYANGTYGRGLIYFQDPLTYDTNVLPAQVADPTIALEYDGSSLVYGVEPTGAPALSGPNELPVRSATYDLTNVAAGFRGSNDATYVTIPEGYSLLLGAIYTFTGTGGVYVSPQNTNGTIGAATKLTALSATTDKIVVDRFSGVSGVWIWVGKSGAGASTATLRAMIGRLVKDDQSQVVEVARNLFTNPRLVGSGTYAEVRRNRALSPIAAATVWDGQYGSGGAGTTTIQNIGVGSAPTCVVEWTTSPTGGAYRIRMTATSTTFIPVVAGEQVTLSLDAAASSGQVRFAWDWYSGATFVSSGNGTITTVSTDPANPTRMTQLTNAAPAGADILRVHLVPLTLPPVGLKMYASRFMVGTGVYFDGSTPTGSIDPDMRQRWLGTANASESVMEIETVRGFTATNAIAGKSMWDGKPALRVIPTTTDPASYAQINGALTSQLGNVSAMGTVHVPVAQTGIKDLTARMVTINTAGFGAFVSLPGAVTGTTPLRVVTSGRTGPDVVNNRFYNGASQGNGDVWWTDIGLFAGSYDGPAFSGSDPVDGNIFYAWSGAVDNSESIMYQTPTSLAEAQKGPWMGGQGNSGCRFVGKPTLVENTGVDGGQVGFACTLVEVGSWVNG